MKVRKRSITNFLQFLFLLYPSFRCIGFEMMALGTATPVYMQVWSLCSLIYSVFLLLYKRKFEKVDLPIYVYCGYMLLLSLYVRTTGQVVALTSLASYITAFTGTIYCIKQFKKKVINYYFIFFAGLFLIEWISTIFPGNGYFQENDLQTFIGHVQIYSMAWTCLAVFALLTSENVRFSRKSNRKRYNRIVIWSLFILGTIISISSGVIATEIAMFVFIAAYFVFKYRKINQSRWLLVIFFLAMILNVMVVFLNFQNKFSSLLGHFGENASLNGRTYIWSLFIPEISESPIIGHGYKVFGVVLSKWGHDNNMDYCHNTILQEIMHGGFIQLVLFIWLNIYAIRRLRKTNNIHTQHALFCGLCTLFVVMISESVTYYNYWNIIIAIVVNVNYLTLDSSIYRKARVKGAKI